MSAYISLSSKIDRRALIGVWALKQTKTIHVVRTQSEQDLVVNRVSSFFSKGCHKGTQTELKII